MSDIVIWEPRWKDRVVLIARHKVGAENHITFVGAPKAKRPPTGFEGVFYITGDDVRKYPIETNGTIPCYAVPVDVLIREGEVL